MYTLYRLKGLTDMLGKDGYNYDILKMSSKVYCICDMNDNQRIIKSWSLAFLIWFCEWLLFIK